jgi:type I restriction enzyme R subunit
MSPFDGQGGLGKMFKLFGVDTNNVLDELNEALVA